MKKVTQFTFLFAAFAACTIWLTSCQPAKPDLDKIKTEIQGMENAYADGMNAKDANAVVVYYADDAVSMDNNAPSAAGKDAILKLIQTNIANDTANLKVSFEVVDLYAAGDIAVETGKATYKDSAGNIARTSKYMSLFEKRDGKYICIRDIYNNDSK